MPRRTNSPQGPHILPKLNRRDIAAARHTEHSRASIRCASCGRAKEARMGEDGKFLSFIHADSGRESCA